MPGLDLPTALRVAAFAFVIMGFVGAYKAGASPVGAASPFSLLVLAGVGCAVASVYLAIYRRQPGAESKSGEAD